MLSQAVILAGGRGARLGEVARTVPKPLVAVGGIPFVEHLIWNLQRHGIRRVVLSIGHLGHQFRECFGDGSRHGVRISYIAEKDPAGTGGALKLAGACLEDAFWVLNGDTLFDIDYFDLARLLQENGTDVALALRHVENAERYGSIVLEEGRIRKFREKAARGPGVVNGGVYAMRRSVLEHVTKLPCSLETDVLPVLAVGGRVAGKTYDGFFIDIGTPESLRDAQESLPRWRRRAAEFPDRDAASGACGQAC